MWLIVIGVIIGLVVTALLKAWSRYEAVSNAALQDQTEQLQRAVIALSERIEALEAIVVNEGDRIKSVDSDVSSGFESPTTPRKDRSLAT